MSTKTTFSSKIGLIAATVGSAVGLGNVWRFPSEAQGNGGAAFLVVYIGCVFLLGVPVMLAEFSLGRAGGSDAVGSFKNLTPHKKWWIIGIVALIASYLILSFYMVVTGWTLEYMWHSITGSLYDGITGAAGSPAVNQQFTEKMHQMTSTAISPLIWTYIALIANLVILLRGVQKGIEKMANILMPALFVVLIIFCCMSLTLPHAGEGVLFFLDPDFSKINATVVIDALGQAFFSLSLGMGILVTYASYYPKDTMLTRTAVTVSSLDFLVSFMMGLIIFPAIKSFGLDGDSAAFQGTTLIFVTLPEVFHSIGATQFWSILFFFLLFVAALTSTISIAEVSIAFIHERLNLSRTKACLYVIIPVFFTSAVCSLSLGSLMWLKVGSMSVFDFLDKLTTDLLLPVSAIFICVYVGWILPKDFIKKELTNYGEFSSWMAPFVQFLIKYICPVLIALVLISKLIDTLSK
jgi:NSS family neurotransmitter:Na+ symporter